MISLLQRYKVGMRLTMAFGLMILLLVAMAAAALYNLSRIETQIEDVVEVNVEKIEHTNYMMHANNVLYVSLSALLMADKPEVRQQELKTVAESRATYDEHLEALEKLPTSEIEKVSLEKIAKAREAGEPARDEVIALAARNQIQAANELLVTEAAPLMKPWEASLQEGINTYEKANEEAFGATHEAFSHARLLMMILVGLAVALAGALAYLIARSLVAPLSLATRVADDLAQGKLDTVIRVQGRDEVSALLASMKTMQGALVSFADAQGEIAREHEAGEIDFRIDAERFPGAYGQMASEINTLVASHLGVQMKTVDIVSRYAKGDLSVDMDRLPGKKAQITAAIDGVKAGMQAINAEISSLVDAAVAGDFNRRGDAQRFEFVYAEMIEGLNALMATADGGLGDVGRLLTVVADGDLSQRADESLPGQFGQLASSANRTVEKLTTIVGEIRNGSEAISSAASEIATGNNDLSQRTEQQAASLEETASSMEELTSTVRATADNARQANQLAIGAVDVASQGGTVVGKVVDTMTAINASSRKIVDIISVIDGIAFQTNILALNAAVEAARAGEQGRGFAVVASEVRSLAQRSASAAKEIKQLIDDSVQKVDTGTRLVDEAGKTMHEIVTSVKRVTDIIADISAASQEQSAGIEQVNQAITQMDESTQQNAALVEEATAAARSMEQQSEQLVQTVAVFRLEAGRDTRVAAPAARRSSVIELPSATRKPSPARPVARPTASPRKAAVQGGGDQDWQEF